jgi:hypothetical protein
VEEEDRRSMSTDARFAKDTRTFSFEVRLGGMDVGNFEADVMLTAERILFEELENRRVLAERLDQFDLTIGRIDKADTHTLRRKIEWRPMRLGREHASEQLKALLD